MIPLLVLALSNYSLLLENVIPSLMFDTNEGQVNRRPISPLRFSLTRSQRNEVSCDMLPRVNPDQQFRRIRNTWRMLENKFPKHLTPTPEIYLHLPTSPHHPA
jgi:hypothetical protein